MSGTSWIGKRVIIDLNKYLFPRKSDTSKSCGSFYRHLSVSCSRNMKFVQFTHNNKPGDVRVGYVDGDKVVDLNKADTTLQSSLLGILRSNQLEKVKQVKSSNPPSVALSSVTLAAPITGVDKVICIGLNYKDHCEEQKIAIPETPMFFSKFSSTITGPNDALKLRTAVTKCISQGSAYSRKGYKDMKNVDWEVELAVVIGKEASNVKASEAFNYIFGYTVAQDISARDWQKKRNGGQFLLGKAMDTFCPIGPWIVTGDEVGDPQTLDIKCSLNGTLKQDSNTDQLINKIPDAIERLSMVMTLLPGDLILTGTPGGVGMYRDPPEYLKPGDVLTSEIEKIGTLTTKVAQF